MTMMKKTKETVFWVIEDCVRAGRSKEDTHRLLSMLFPKIMSEGRFRAWYKTVSKRVMGND